MSEEAEMPMTAKQSLKLREIAAKKIVKATWFKLLAAIGIIGPILAVVIPLTEKSFAAGERKAAVDNQIQDAATKASNDVAAERQRAMGAEAILTVAVSSIKDQTNRIEVKTDKNSEKLDRALGHLEAIDPRPMLRKP